MWTEITRRKYEREGQRYASDLTDAEWAVIAPHMPAVKRLGRPRETELRSVLDAILYIARTGCQWMERGGRGAAEIRHFLRADSTPPRRGRLGRGCIRIL